MKALANRVESLDEQLAIVADQLKLATKVSELTKLDQQLADGNVWNDVEKAQAMSKRAASLRTQIEPWQTLKTQIQDISELMVLADDSLIPELTTQISAMEAMLVKLKRELRFQGKYDDHAAIVTISAGVGGTDAQDWAEMLERMYLRWAERIGMETKLLDRSTGEEAGIKSATYSFSGSYAYGKLQSERGVHRLVRLSPFNADNLRQTSFALVEVMPEIETPDEIELDEKDLKIDVYRAGGHGGQSVNTTDSAVRITHVPTGTVVAIQNERSQLQNKLTAMSLLKSKLLEQKIAQKVDKLSDLRAGESASWGAQIRNYVLHPYTLVKDTRTKYEERDVQAVLDGEIDGFIDSYLEANLA